MQEESEFEEYKKSALEILAEDQVEKQNVGIIVSICVLLAYRKNM